MTLIKSFKELGIAPPTAKGFIGDKISIKKILGKQITVYDYKMATSKFTGQRLDIQICYNDDKRVIFTSSSYLIETIEKIPKDAFPFTTTIIEDNDRYNFT